MNCVRRIDGVGIGWTKPQIFSPKLHSSFPMSLQLGKFAKEVIFSGVMNFFL